MKIAADVETCVGAGQCALVAADLFDQDDDGIVMILNDSPEGADQESARRAAALCPARAISLSSDDG